MAHYEHKHQDPKTGRFVKNPAKPQEKPNDPQAPPKEPPAADPYEPDVDPALERFLANDQMRRERFRRVNRKPAPAPDMNPRERRYPATGPGGEPGDCGGAF